MCFNSSIVMWIRELDSRTLRDHIIWLSYVLQDVPLLVVNQLPGQLIQLVIILRYRVGEVEILADHLLLLADQNFQHLIHLTSHYAIQ